MNQLKVTIETKLPKELFQVLASVGFWNQHGQQVYESNKAGTMGGKYSQAQARVLNADDFILNSLFNDVKTLSESKQPEYWPEGFKCGKGGSHIWVSTPTNERVLFIHSQPLF